MSWRTREELKVPVLLVGDLNAGNIVETAPQVCAFGVDVCNGVLTYGKLNEIKLSGFFTAISSC